MPAFCQAPIGAHGLQMILLVKFVSTAFILQLATQCCRAASTFAAFWMLKFSELKKCCIKRLKFSGLPARVTDMACGVASILILRQAW
ncbi:hypothetical protein COCSUDRAFT_34171 [Coccomyxa subellipsoidea C-169]|uniref:Uncharacterized protein n=1 Tax=Coccomyxa subellipsoidea (strain C-169) TaxID=574566 RepID=I0YME9_COCSC|nr:hypothetical protein COCSUDRAFT_34171 [Coccomyxa subellipsoidea C-169]EIE19568.1 hypothetical protein COCSUDRAFT_34171 [Coccomyxa subellipsoidea C-169]|eukprot:XP_005644112.1 hypothetical protein COCSUDRAFT_34171 [Coccomyxa subellipsoidea C-169]